ncbi:MAG: serine esterase [Oligoflexia bacterium]|nr:serine esterase [Oligoflexia bacterium]
MSLSFKHLPLESIWQPAGPNETNGHLIVVLHGRGDSAEGFAWLQSALGLPGLSALLLNAPNSYYTGFSWYDLPPNQLPGVLSSREQLTRVFQEIARMGFAPERTFLLGFSQGCLMTLEFGARYSTRLAGYVGISGYCYDEKALLAEAVPEIKRADWLVTHGSIDSVLPVERTRGQMQALIQGGFNLEYREYAKDHTIDPREELPAIREWLRKRLLNPH